MLQLLIAIGVIFAALCLIGLVVFVSLFTYAARRDGTLEPDSAANRGTNQPLAGPAPLTSAAVPPGGDSPRPVPASSQTL